MTGEIEYDPENPVKELLALYRTYEWWADRTEADLRRAIRNTDALVVLRDKDTETAVAAARILTDYAFYAMVYDVIVTDTRRGEGIGQRLIEAVVNHPALADMNGISLLSREGLIPFYESCGLELGDETVSHPDDPPEVLRWMRYQRE